MSLVLNAVAACPVFSRHSVKQHYLQPPEQLGFKLSQHLLAIASLQLWCRGKQQRVQMLCCSRPLSALALRLACAANTHQGHRSMQQRVAALVMKRCLSRVGRHESDAFYERIDIQKENERINALLRDAIEDPETLQRLMQHPDVVAIRACDAEAASLLDDDQSHLHKVVQCSILPDAINLGKDSTRVPVTPDQLRQFAQKLPTNTHVTLLNLSYQNIGPEVMLKLIGPLALLTSLRELHLAGTDALMSSCLSCNMSSYLL
jgi:hypothetical protein